MSRQSRKLILGHPDAMDAKLWSRMGKAENEYLPRGSVTFFIHADLGSVTFSRHVRGQVTGYASHRADGQEIHVKEIK